MQPIHLIARARAGAAVFALAAACLCAHMPSAAAQSAPSRAGKICQALPDTNCITWIEAGDAISEGAGLQIVEPSRDSSSKLLRVFVRFSVAVPSQNGTIEVTLDSRPFASLVYTSCVDRVCIVEMPVSDAQIAMLERASAIQVRSVSFAYALQGSELTQARASRGLSAADLQKEQERRLEDARKKGAAISKKLAEDTATPPREPDKENCGSIMLPDNEAIAACNRAIASGKYKGRDLADLFHTRGLKYGTMGLKEQGTADFNAAIRADPTFAPAYAERGGDYMDQRRFDLAIKDFNEALRFGGEDTSTLFSRGLAYRYSGQRDRAIADFRRVYQLNPRIDVARKELRELGVEP